MECALTVRRTSRKRVEEVLIRLGKRAGEQDGEVTMIWLPWPPVLLVSFIFSGIEAGIFSVNRVRLKHRVKLGDSAALKLNRLLAQPERLLITVLVVTNLMNIFALTLATQELSALVGSARLLYRRRPRAADLSAWSRTAAQGAVSPLPLPRARGAWRVRCEIADLLLSPMHFVGQAVAEHFPQTPPGGAGQALRGARGFQISHHRERARGDADAGGAADDPQRRRFPRDDGARRDAADGQGARNFRARAGRGTHPPEPRDEHGPLAGAR